MRAGGCRRDGARVVEMHRSVSESSWVSFPIALSRTSRDPTAQVSFRDSTLAVSPTRPPIVAEGGCLEKRGRVASESSVRQRKGDHLIETPWHPAAAHLPATGPPRRRRGLPSAGGFRRGLPSPGAAGAVASMILLHQDLPPTFTGPATLSVRLPRFTCCTCGGLSGTVSGPAAKCCTCVM